MSIINKPVPTFNVPAVMPNGMIQASYTQEDLLNGYEGAVVVFYPMDFTFVCPSEIYAYADLKEQFTAININLVVVSTDSEYVHLAWRDVPRKMGGVGELQVPMLADRAHVMSRAFGVLVEEAGVALRGTFYIGKDNLVRAATIHDLPVGRNADEMLRTVKAFQFTDKHGEVCPAKWEKEGDATIVADPQDKLKYFNDNA